AAREVAHALGMLSRSAVDTGTSILIVDPVMNGDGVESMPDDIVEAVLWNFWPRMAASTPAARSLRVEVELDGDRVPVPAPEDFPPLDLFAAAIGKHRTKSEDLRPIWCLRPQKQIARSLYSAGCALTDAGPL